MFNLGNFPNNIKRGNTRLSMEQLGRVAEVDPHGMETMTTKEDHAQAPKD